MGSIKEIMKEDNINISNDKVAQLPLVSICSITYNHAPYIRQCLDGFLMQKTNFKYEIIIHDDASTDGTTEIIKEYAEKYPDLITPVFQTENQYSKGLRGFFAKFVFPHAKGKYIALCEGDDFWIDPYKLQKQVDFMEANPEYSMCFHSIKEILDESVKDILSKPIMQELKIKDYDGIEILKKWTIPTCSVLFNNNCYRKSKYLERIKSNNYIYGDIILFLSLAETGKIRCLTNKPLAIYRRHIGGITFKLDGLWEKKIKHFENIKNDFNGKYAITCNLFLAPLYFDLFTSYYSINKFNSFYYLIKSFFCSPQTTINRIKMLAMKKH